MISAERIVADACDLRSVAPYNLGGDASPMLVTLSGIEMLVNSLHPENALLPMLVTLLGIVMLVKPLHSENALLPMLVTLLGMVKVVP